MTTSQQTQTRELPLEEKTVADYLRDNPEFFHNNASLLAYQNSQLKRKLMDLVHVARDNNRLNERMHQLTLGLINAHSLEALLDTLRENLLGEFKADTVTMRLAGMPEAQARECGVDILDPEAVEMVHFESFLKSSRPQCGRFKQEQLQYLFGDQAQAIESVALIPLGRKARLGLLAIGSREASRFHPGMGTLFLTHLGELTGLLLSEHIDLDTPATA